MNIVGIRGFPSRAINDVSLTSLTNPCVRLTASQGSTKFFSFTGKLSVYFKYSSLKHNSLPPPPPAYSLPLSASNLKSLFPLIIHDARRLPTSLSLHPSKPSLLNPRLWPPQFSSSKHAVTHILPFKPRNDSRGDPQCYGTRTGSTIEPSRIKG